MRGPLAGKDVLIVDDEEDLRDLLGRALVAEGARVTCAAGGVQALNLCRQHEFDAVITDLRMPGGDGLMLIQKLRELGSTRTSFFVCSGFGDLAEDTVQRLGVARIFEKPFNLREMIREVCRILAAP